MSIVARAVALVVTLSVVACGPRSPAPTQGARATEDNQIARWIPTTSVYAVAAVSVRVAQDTIRRTAGPLAPAVTLGLSILTFEGADPLSAAGLTELGIDVDGPVAVYAGADLYPSVVVRVGDPARASAWLARRTLPGELRDGWLVLHSRAQSPAAPNATPPLTIEVGRAIAGFVRFDRLPERYGLARCLAQLPEPRLAFGIAVAGATVRADVTLALPPAHRAAVGRALLAPPGQWAVAARAAPFAAQWNLDLDVVARWLDPCARALGLSGDQLVAPLPVRAGRVIVQAFDPHEKTGRGAAAVELRDPALLTRLLDEIPLRSTLESNRTFGGYAGKHLSIPFGPTIDYALHKNLVLVGIGDGVLARVLGDPAAPPASSSPPLAAFDVVPAALSREAWSWLFQQIGAPDRIGSSVELLLRFRRLGIAVTLEPEGIRLQLAAEAA
jgi:hypothetical protein